jgi:GDP-L-fucose synthase
LSDFWRNRRVFLTGGGGFLGSFIREELLRRNPEQLLAPRQRELDLLDVGAVRTYLQAHKPNLIVHAAAMVGGIAANGIHPGKFFYENTAMGIHLIEEARRAGIEKLVCLGTICSYPKFTPVPFREDDLWNGYPEETNAPYGIAKKALLVQLQSYRREYGFNGIFLLPVNLYGPRDNFDPQSSHVIPAMIRKFIEARSSGAQSVTLWGDGTPTREFLFVEDAAAAIVTAAEKYDGDLPVNLGSGEEISVAGLADVIAKKIGYAGQITWDASRPNGQPRRRLDVSRAATVLGFRATTPLNDGLDRTIAWYREQTRTAVSA